MPAQRHRELIALNIGGLTDMLAHFVPPMVARGHGRVLNVASIAAFQPIPTLATYAATKAYVLSLSESLSEELHGSGVTVTALRACQWQRCQASPWPRGHIPLIINHIPRVPRRSHFVDGSKGW